MSDTGGLTLKEISQLSHLTLHAAAAALGVSTSSLKKCCRKHGLTRWPNRQQKSMKPPGQLFLEAAASLSSLPAGALVAEGCNYFSADEDSHNRELSPSALLPPTSAPDPSASLAAHPACARNPLFRFGLLGEDISGEELGAEAPAPAAAHAPFAPATAAAVVTTPHGAFAPTVAHTPFAPAAATAAVTTPHGALGAAAARPLVPLAPHTTTTTTTATPPLLRASTPTLRSDGGDAAGLGLVVHSSNPLIHRAQLQAIAPQQRACSPVLVPGHDQAAYVVRPSSACEQSRVSLASASPGGSAWGSVPSSSVSPEVDAPPRARSQGFKYHTQTVDADSTPFLLGALGGAQGAQEVADLLGRGVNYGMSSIISL